YVVKPDGAVPAPTAMQAMADDLVAKIDQCCPDPTRDQRRATIVRNASGAQEPRIDCVVIAISTGGPQALMEVIPKLPADLPVPVLVVQHMPPIFTRLLAERLEARSRIQVREGQLYQTIGEGEVWIAPG